MNVFTSAASLIAGAVVAIGVLEVGDAVFPAPIIGSGVATEPVRAGSVTLVSWTLDKKTECPGQNSRVWDGVNDFHLTEPAQISSLPEGKISPMIETRIPELAPPGVLELRIKGFYQCDTGGKMRFELGPVLFEVIE